MALLFCVMLAGPLLAQAPEQKDEDGAAADETVNTPAIAKEDSPPDTIVSPQRSPYDYRPSEDISEDLSVSFPVDI